jgi:hypothetical protein
VQRVAHALAQLVAVQAPLDVVALELIDDRLAVCITNSEIGSRPQPTRGVHDSGI